MNVVEVVNRTRIADRRGAVARLVARVLEEEGVRGAEVDVTFVGERRMRALNREYRDKDEVTDVLCFPLEEWEEDGRSTASATGRRDGSGAVVAASLAPDLGDVAEAASAGEDGPPLLLGDIVVCARRALRQAARRTTPAVARGGRPARARHPAPARATTTRRTPARWRSARPRCSSSSSGRASLSRRRGSLLTSFNFAFDGIVHALRTERNMWIHFGIAALVLVAALFFALTRLEVIALLVAISFVVIAEMFNTAIEHVVDLVTDEDDPRARIAKDVAAGAVLVAAVNAVGGRLPRLLRQDHRACRTRSSASCAGRRSTSPSSRWSS